MITKNSVYILLKCPYYGLWKVHILVLGDPNNRLTCMHGQKALSFSYNMHLFLPYLLNDSQTIRSTINFSKPLLCVMLICGDWSDWSHFHCIMPVMSDKAAFVSAVLLCVQPLRGKQLFLLQKQHLVAKNEFAFSFRWIYPHSADHSLFSTWCYPQDPQERRLPIYFKRIGSIKTFYFVGDC